MGAFISQQPNGRYCRFSTVIDSITDYNMTKEDYIEMCAMRARDEAKFELENRLVPFRKVKDCFLPTNDSVEEFNALLKNMGDTEQMNPEDYGIDIQEGGKE